MTPPSQPERIAIVGVGGIFPGAPDLDTFWKNIANGVDCGRHVPDGRWYLSPETAYAPWPPQPDRVYSTWGCFIEGFQFDPEGLNLDRSLLERLDPMFHLGLHAARAAFRDAKQLAGIDHARVGVILGNIALPTESTSAICRDVLGRTFWEELSVECRVSSARRTDVVSSSSSGTQHSALSTPPSSGSRHSALDTRLPWHPLNRFAAGLPASLIAEGLGLGGVAFTLDAACASSLYALKFASEELLAHRADAMLAGGMSRPDCQYTQMGFAQLQALSKSGRCAPLSGEADGLVVGEGAGVFVLKRLSDAVAAGDHIYGVIAGIGLSNDRGANLLAPHSEGQLRAMRSAYEQAVWQPSDVDLIECHATGTPVGDAVEIESLHQLWQHENARPQQCVIGGVKSNVGHLLTGAGAAGLMKVLFALKHRTLPPTANYRQPAEKLSSSNSPFHVLAKSKPWPQRTNGTPRRATINAFGFGGINAHVLIEEWCDDNSSIRVPSPPSSGERVRVRAAGDVDTLNAQCLFEERRTPHPDPLPSKARGEGTREVSIPIAIVGQSTIVGEPSDDAPHVRAITEVRMPLGQFRIPPLEMQDMLPQQQLMLKIAAEALRESSDECRVMSASKRDPSSLPPALDTRHSSLDSPLDPSRTGVFIGTELDPNTTNFHLRWSIEQDAPRWAEMLDLDLSPDELAEWTKQLKEAAGPPLTPNRVMGNLGGIVASRLAREFDVGGPSFTISAGGDGGGVAFHVAVGMLQRGELDRAIVGAVDLPCDVRSLVGGLERDPQDGAIAFILERLEDARQNGTRVLSVLERTEGTKGTQGTKGIREVERGHGGVVTFEDRWVATDHLATDHSTSVNADAPVATDQLLSSFKSFPSLPPQPAPLSPKQFRPSAATISVFDLWREATNPPKSLFRTPTGWREPLGKSGRVAFVFPGSGNAFVGMGRELLEKFPDVLRRQEAQNQRLRDQYRPDLIWEGRSNSELLANHKAMIFGQVAIGTAVCDLLALFRVRPSASIGYSLGESAALFGLRAWTDRDEMLRRMEESPLFGSDLVAPFDAARKAWNVPDGEPVDWVSGVIDRSADEVRAAMASLVPSPPSSGERVRVRGPNGEATFDETTLSAISQTEDQSPPHPNPLPSKARGEGTGDANARREEPLTLTLSPQSWGEETGEDGKTEETSRVYLLIVNTPTQCVIGGERSAVEQLVRDMAATFVPFSAPSTVHCEVLRAVEARYRELHLMRTKQVDGRWSMVDDERQRHSLSDHQPSTLNHQTSPIDFYSTAWGCKYVLTRESAAEAIVAQAVGTIDFPRVIEQAYADGVRVFVEIGPGSSCTRMIDEILGDRPHLARSALPNTSRPVETFLELLAALIAEGVPVDLSYLYGNSSDEWREARARDGEAKTPVREIVTRIGGLPFEIPTPPGGWKFREELSDESRESNAREEAAASFNRVGNAPRVECNSTLFCPSTRGAMPTRLNEERNVSLLSEPVTDDLFSGTRHSTLVTRLSSGTQHSALSTQHFSSLNLFNQLQLMTDHRTQAHDTFLRFSARAERLAAQHLAMLQRAGGGKNEIDGSDVIYATDDESLRADDANAVVNESFQPQLSNQSHQPHESYHSHQSHSSHRPNPQRPTPPRSLNRDECMTFAIGRIGDCLGTMFAEIDQHPTRVRLPDEPLMLVDRILSIEGEPLSMTSGRVVTEHDIHPGAWYLDCDRIPTCIAVESGQADLFLSGWLGIDFITKGLACYRLLDAVVTFHDELPQAGKTINYDIRVLHFFRQGETYLFRFEFDATVDGKPLLTMREGCAGFFTQAELAGGKGIIHTALDKRPRPGKRPADWSDPVPMAVESYDDSQLLALRQGDLATCFGPAFAGLPLREPVTIPGLENGRGARAEGQGAENERSIYVKSPSASVLSTQYSALNPPSLAPQPSPLSRSRMWLIDRVLKLDPVGGKFGMGTILGELDIHPDDWFLTCHFCDDQVMPGTLMYECCMHTLRIFLLRMGWVGEAGQIAYQPIPEIRSRLKCRGQVLSSTKKVWYEVTLKEIGYGASSDECRVSSARVDRQANSNGLALDTQHSSLDSSAYCLADALMYADGKPIVEITDMSVCLTGLSREKVERLWSSSGPLAPALRGEGWGEGLHRSSQGDVRSGVAADVTSYEHGQSHRTHRQREENPLTLALSPQSRGEGTTVAAPRESEANRVVPRDSSLALDTRHSTLDSSSLAPQPSPLSPRYDLRPAIFNTDRITAFAIGKPSEAFGDKYRVFDDERKIARLPGPPFQFLDRVVSIENCQPWKLESGGEIVAQYDIPVDAWYFAANRQPTMPFAVLLETALQPCGWLAGYLGSALTSETDLSFRNLGGKAIQYRDVTPQSGTLTTKVKITKVSQSGGMIIQNFDYHLSCNGEPVYVGDTYFGFFSKASLANQVGIRDAKVFVPSAEESARASRFNVPDAAPFANSEYMMIDNAELLLDGGPHGLGYVRGTMQVDPTSWFFKAHFYQDPVVPGSLGLESFFQLMKFYAASRWRLGADAVFQTPSQRSGQWTVGSGQAKTLPTGAASPTMPQAPSAKPHEWVYRGQVVPKDSLVTVTAVVTEVDDATRQLTAEGFLSVDGRVIYQMKSFTLCVSDR